MPKTTPTAPPASVRFSLDGKALYVSDPDPEDATTLRIARDVYTHSAEMLRGRLTEAELRFVAKSLRQSLGDLLDMVATMPDTDTDADTPATEADTTEDVATRPAP